jgi:phenylalanyl-tRNA synthetase beta chain
MRISMRWLSDYVSLPPGVGPADVARELTLRTVEVEQVTPTLDGDTVLEVDNKSLTNRPDLWGHYGIARELSAIYRVPLADLPRGPRPSATTGLVGDLDPAVCSRFCAVAYAIDGPTPETPLWIRERLAAIGEASRGLHVDLTNYVMFAVGQPTHAYDADRTSPPLSVAGTAGAETLRLVSAGAVHVDGAVPLVRDRERAVGLAGIMGAAEVAVNDTTRGVILEAATLAPVPVRRAALRLGLRTEASARYEKGLDTQRVDQAVDLYLHLLVAAVPGVRLLGLQDEAVRSTEPARVEVTDQFLHRGIGAPVPAEDVDRILGALGFTVDRHEAGITVTAPTWRSTGDIGLPHDVLEEVARIIGYDDLPVAPLTVPLKPVRSLNRRPVERVVAERLAAAGLREVLTYPWTSDGLLAACGFERADAVRLADAPAPDRECLRPSLIPNLVEAAAANLRHRDRVSVFEVGAVFTVDGESTRAAALVSDVDGQAAFLRLKGILESVARGLALIADAEHPGWADRSARAAVTAAGSPLGSLGLLTRRVRRLVGLDAVQVACLELDLGGLAGALSRVFAVDPPPELPDAGFDLSVVVADSVAWADLATAARGADPLVHRVDYLDEFRGSWVPAGHRCVSLRVTLRPTEATLGAGPLAAARSEVLQALAEAVGAHLRSPE